MGCKMFCWPPETRSSELEVGLRGGSTLIAFVGDTLLPPLSSLDEGVLLEGHRFVLGMALLARYS